MLGAENLLITWRATLLEYSTHAHTHTHTHIHTYTQSYAHAYIDTYIRTHTIMHTHTHTHTHTYIQRYLYHRQTYILTYMHTECLSLSHLSSLLPLSCFFLTCGAESRGFVFTGVPEIVYYTKRERERER